MLIIILALIFINFLNADLDLNLYRRYDVNFKPYRQECKPSFVAFLYEHTLNTHARNIHGHKKNVLQLWNDDIDTLAMVRGFKKESEIGQLATALNLVNDDGMRGRIVPTGHLKGEGFSTYLRYNLPHDMFISLFIPYYSVRFSDVCFEDITPKTSFLDNLTQDKLTNNFQEHVKHLGKLNLCPWKKNGFGDLMGTIEWDKEFIQEKPVLNSVHINGRLGVNIPTGVKSDEDQLFSIPFGYQHWGLYFGAGIDLIWWNFLKGGVDAEYLQLFARERDVRIRTDKGQTDLVLLAKTRAIVDPGFVSRYNIYLEANRFWRDLSLRVAFEYFRTTRTDLYLINNDFSNEIANSSDALGDNTIHQLVFLFGKEWGYKNCDFNLSLFYKLPFNGKRSIQNQTIGFNFWFNF